MEELHSGAFGDDGHASLRNDSTAQDIGMTVGNDVALAQFVPQGKPQHQRIKHPISGTILIDGSNGYPWPNSYVFVIADYFTKWMEAYPILNHCKLVDNFFCSRETPFRPGLSI